MDATPRPDRTAALARGLLFAHLLLSPLAFTTGTVEAFEFNKVALLHLTALGLLGLGLAQSIRRGGLPRLPREPVTLGFLAFTVSAAVSTVLSVSPRTSFFGAHESFAGLTTVAAYLVLFLATRSFCRTTTGGWRLLTAAVLGAAVASAYALLQVMQLDPIHWNDVSAVGGYVRPFGTLGHPNHLAAYLVMGLPVLVGFALRAAARGHSVRLAALSGVGLLALAGIVLALSRGAWLALAVVAPLMLAGLWRCGYRRAVRVTGWSLACGGMAVVVFGLLAGGAFRDSLARRLHHLGESAGRPALWGAGWGMFCERPLTGAGLDTYQLAFGRHRPAAFWREEWNVTPTKAHNEAVHVLATQGLLGAAAVLALITGLGWAFTRVWRQSCADDRLLVLAAGCGAVGFLVQGLFSFTVAGCGTLFVTFAALLARLGNRPALSRGAGEQGSGGAKRQRLFFFAPLLPRSLAPPLFYSGIAAAVVWLAWAGVVQPYRADVLTHTAAALRASDPVRALVLHREALQLDPGRAILWSEFADTAQTAARLAADAEDRQRYGRHARKALTRAANLVPASAALHTRLGDWLLELAGSGMAEPADALAAYDAAIDRDPYNPCVLARAARAACACGRPEVARGYLRRGLAFVPDEADVLATLGWVELAEGHVEEAEARFATTTAVDWHGHEDGQLLARALWAYCLLRLGQADVAALALQAVIDRRPDWPAPRLTLAHALARLGRPEAADEYRRVIALAPGHPFADEARRCLVGK